MGLHLLEALHTEIPDHAKKKMYLRPEKLTFFFFFHSKFILIRKKKIK